MWPVGRVLSFRRQPWRQVHTREGDDQMTDETQGDELTEFQKAFAIGRANVRETAMLAALDRADEILAKLDGAVGHEERRDALRDVFCKYERTMRDMAVLASVALGL